MNHQRKNENGPEKRRPGIVLEDCVAFGNGGAGFLFEGVNVTGKNLVARDNAGGGIVVVDSRGNLADPEIDR